jgi:hypothetical protein
MTRPILLWSNLLLIGTILTLATGLVCNPIRGFGFPFPWKTGGCPPPGVEISASCLLAIGHDWLSFGLDVLFYTLVGYGLVLGWAKYHAGKVTP